MNYKFRDEEDRNVRLKNFTQIGEKVFSFFLEEAPQRGFEEREGQWDMACDIVTAMRDKKHILVEAGVGIGKSFAYIVPLLYYHKEYKRPILIATSTIALQEQLVSDIEIIENMINYHPSIILAKGQNHFLCLKRFEEYFLGINEKSDTYDIYTKLSQGGHEKSDWDIDISEFLWKRINVREFNPIYCRQKCSYKDKCYYYNLRKSLSTTQGIVLCNQDLLTVNMHKRYDFANEIIVNTFQFVVIDEVHNLESKVRNSYTIELSYNSCVKVIEQAIESYKGFVNLLEDKVKKYHQLLDDVFNDLVNQTQKQDCFAKKNDKEIDRYKIDSNISKLPDLVRCIHDIHLEISMQFGIEDTYRSRGSLDDVLEGIEHQEEFFTSLKSKDSKDIFWMSKFGKGKTGIHISKCPQNVNELTNKLFFSDSKFSTILTSATITSGDESNYIQNYNYFISNTNFPVNSGFISEPKISPFNYDEHAIIYYTEHMPHPSKNREKFIEDGVKEIITLLNITQGKAMILFTAKRDMNDVYNLLKNKIPYKLLIQNNSSSQNDVIKEFKSDVNSVLLGSGTYWEGISIEGVALSNLIIFKLPFPVPEPVIDYKVSICKNGLMDVLVPEMIIKLKQGIGRLIRNKEDTGIVSIIDSRVGDNSRVSYKNLIWESLPIKNRTNSIDKIKDFYTTLSQ